MADEAGRPPSTSGVKRVLLRLGGSKAGSKRDARSSQSSGVASPDVEAALLIPSDQEPSDSSDAENLPVFSAWAAMAEGRPSPSSVQHWIVRSQNASSESGGSERKNSEDKRRELPEPTSDHGYPPEQGAPHSFTDALFGDDEEFDLLGFPSVGSRFHASGQCMPCRFVTLPDGCRNGIECTFCHNEEHQTDPNSAQRPPKGVRSGYKKSVTQVLESDLPEKEKRSALKKLAGRSPYLRALVRRAVPDISDDSNSEGEASQPKMLRKPATQLSL